ncbi:uncharacterized protein LOC116016065 [Ipomoea triloba]|uniref:uncharacterized protein LOC116016065 n=1 Tax=Ipomoea triloba TaxID=35885 RepID=UPI00125D4034|nr:uncharacterized protein LOC116016065 [Ipomoea triloba]
MEALGLEVRRLQAQMEKMNKAQRGTPCMTLALYCDKCGGAHGAHECTFTYDDGSYEQVDVVGYQRPNDFNSYGNNNSQNWRQGQGWQNQTSQNQGWQGQGQRPNQGGPRGDIKTTGDINITKINQEEEHIDHRCTKEAINHQGMKHLRKVLRTKWKDISNLRQENHASMRNLETQVAQNSKALAERPQGALPSTTVNNPRERVQAVTLRSGKELPEPILKKGANSKSPIEEVTVEEVLEEEKEKEKGNSPLPISPKVTRALEKAKDNVYVPMYQPPLPYPGRVKKSIDKTQYGKFLDLLKQLHINVPFLDALGQMPHYAKFLKDLLTNKRKLEDSATVLLGEGCSAFVRHKPQKLTDPGSFTIPCQIGDTDFSQALADSGANRVDKFIFPVDFVTIDMDPDHEVSLILGRPFFATARALIDVGSAKLVLRVGDECATFDVSKLTKYPMASDDTYYFVDIFHEHVESIYSNFLGKMKNDAHLKVLCDDNGIESLALVDKSLTHKHVSDMHETPCDDDEMNFDASLLELNDVEFETFLDNCLDDALYIHDLLGEDKEEMEGDLWDVLLTKEKEGEKESVTIEKDGKSDLKALPR